MQEWCFLREIAKRLIVGLEKEIPDLQERLNHIYTKQLFGIAITELTALLSRRSTYCSKKQTDNIQYATLLIQKKAISNLNELSIHGKTVGVDIAEPINQNMTEMML